MKDSEKVFSRVVEQINLDELALWGVAIEMGLRQLEKNSNNGNGTDFVRKAFEEIAPRGYGSGRNGSTK